VRRGQPANAPAPRAPQVSEATNFEYYMRKTYLKTASLLAHSCMGAVLLGGDETLERRAAASTAFEYGKHLGLAFQIQDDVLDFQVVFRCPHSQPCVSRGF